MSSNVEISRADVRDRDAVRQVCEACYKDDYILRMGDRFLTTGTVLMARVKDEPVGLVRLTTTIDGAGWLSALRVVPSKRHEGVGTALCRACEEVAARNGSGTMRLWTEETNDAAYSLFRGLSYRKVGVFTRWWGEALGEGEVPRASREVGDIWPRVSATKLYGASRYVPIELRFCRLSETVIRNLASSQRLYQDDLGGPCILDRDVWKAFGEDMVELTLLADNVAAQVRAAWALASGTSSHRMGTFLPAGEPWSGIAEDAGLREGDWGNRAVLCEKVLR